MEMTEEKYYLCLQLREEMLCCYLVGTSDHLPLYYLFLMYQY